MTNEELAIRAKAHEDFAVLELWEGVRRYVEMKAAQYLRFAAYDTLAEYEDLVQDGFIAMLDAVELFDPERGAGFLTILTYALQKSFAEEGGHRRPRRDAIQFAFSLDAPIYNEDEIIDNFVDVMHDPCGEYAFALVEYRDYIRYVNRLIHAAMDRLTSGQRESIEKHYFQGLTFDEIANSEGCPRQSVHEIGKRGLMRLRRGKYCRELYAALRGFDDFNELCFEHNRRLELQSIEK